MKENWINISTKEDVQDFLNLYGYFHDSCIKELKCMLIKIYL